MVEIWHLNYTKPYTYFSCSFSNLSLGRNNGFAPRFLGFSLYVSNTKNKADGTVCFEDTNFNLDTIPAVFNTTCFLHGQYVIYYNERLARKTYPVGYSNYSFNELCELEVFGMSYFLANLYFYVRKKGNI